MEINIKLNATESDMDKFFKFDEVISVRYCKMIKTDKDNNIYKCIVRIPECSLSDSNYPISIKELKNKVVKSCKKYFPVTTDVEYSNGEIRRFYSPNDYWKEENKKSYAKLFNLNILKETAV